MIITPDVNYADKYANNVMRNKKKYPKSIILAVERYKKWKKRQDIWFDVDRANEMLDFVQSFVRHVKGQACRSINGIRVMGNVCFANMYGWYHKMKKVRPFVLFVNHMCKSQRKRENHYCSRCIALCDVWRR